MVEAGHRHGYTTNRIDCITRKKGLIKANGYINKIAT